MYRQLSRWVAVYGLIVAIVLGTAMHATAQTPSANVEGRWEGALDTGQAMYVCC
jgi:hypothetical protein